MMRKNKLIIILLLGINWSCTKPPSFIGKLWVIDEIKTFGLLDNYKKCFRSTAIVLREDGTFTIPGFDSAFDYGFYTLNANKDIISLGKQNDCFFKRNFKIKVIEGKKNKDILIMENNFVTIRAHSVGFKNNMLNFDAFGNALDTLSFNSKICISYRKKLCAHDR